MCIYIYIYIYNFKIGIITVHLKTITAVPTLANEIMLNTKNIVDPI